MQRNGRLRASVFLLPREARMSVSRRTFVWLGLAAALWLVTLFVLLPAIVRGAYAGESIIPWLNGAIQGQSQHPLAYYQSLARRAALLATAAAMVALVAAYGAWRWRSRIAAAWSRVVYHAPTMGATDVIVSAACFGWLSGLVESAYLFSRFASDPPEALSWHVLWMGPLSAACLGAIVGALVALALRAWRGVSVALAVMLFSSFAIYAIVANLRLGIHKYAAVVLSLGAAIQLGRLASRHARSFTTWCRRSLPWMGVAVGAVLLLGTINGVLRVRERVGGTPPADAPNVLFLILDTVRAQDLSLYGYGRQTSPELERLASRGVTFDRAIVTSSWTLPSHASMFTGLPPDQLSSAWHAPLDASAPTIAEVLRDRGYATGGFVANMSYTTRASGLDRGFTTYRDHRVALGLFLSSSHWVRKTATRIRPRLAPHGALVRKSAAEVNREFLEWLPADGRPFFAFLNYFDAHTPYKLERPFDRKFRDPPPRFWRFDLWMRSLGAEDLQEFRDSYDSAIAYLDAELGAMLREMERRGALRNTVVIVASDHGEHLGEHGGLIGHGNSLYLELLHVPLVISYPSRIPHGVRVERAVSMQNIPATILDLLGGPAGKELPGRSLAGYWNPEASDRVASADSMETIFSELSGGDFADRDKPARRGNRQSLMHDRFHYIRNGDGTEELYDYVADYDERQNLAGGPDSTSVLAPYRQLLAQRTAGMRMASRRRDP